MDKEVLLQQLGARIRAIRKEKGITQTDLANKLDKDQPTINKLETGKFNPSYLFLTEIASGLGVTLRDIFEGE
ncbi:MAG: helix-turn-helix transcriptional regulator [Bacteroidetes bacterium]|nr:helix-turn-helix transcriptional regulator [Bacteroidota bacterium]